ncbi:diguanylate cyclase (GGDEF)-like protein/PAS domain S-box-containing protein [Sphingobium fontiphilum]|uniref:Diguanylate cyclase (GGDEF)-like protein/PAS domain S-box-containing protein n=1 Tax=Sphingobium fontiphilum TaxID=944425 RepID=A0A7W6GNS1_9SPHN|nr:EAL domain-containing protein [Sphingobium fontiphilum]MBB3981827.1 diguanylate cyclase (GGDEF)-like protein/PAS domain S-box-containing protein [Sphingobium fontiphilum]
MALLGLADGGVEVATSWITDALRGIAMVWPMVLIVKLCISLMLGASAALTQTTGIAIAIALLMIDGAIMLLPRLALFRHMLPHVQMRAILPLMLLSGASFGLWINSLPIETSRHALYVLAPEMAVALLAACILGDRRVLTLAYCVGALLVSSYYSPTATQLSLLVSTALVIGIATVRQVGTDRRRAVEQHSHELRSMRSDRLLHEYEKSGRGWFWETDRNGCLIYLSDTLIASLGIRADEVIGRPITEIVLSGDKRQGDGERTLGFHLSARTAFADIAVRAALSQEERWWSISGQPVFNDYGQFYGFRGNGTDLTEMRRSQAEVTRLAQYDSLTGLANRVHMLRSLEQAVAGSRGQPGECVLMMLDLDRFKTVNDTLGHPAGDALLRQVSQRLQRVVGDKGLVGRQGGDEFKIILPGHHENGFLSELAQTIISNVSQPYTIEGNPVVIGVSIGISCCPRDGVTSDALIRNADLALYAAKGDGRGVHRFYSPEMHADAEDRRQLEEDLRHALAAGGLHLVYQPVVSSRTEKVTGYEVLLRWTHPVRGPISPALFIPIAEDGGLIAQIGEWVMRTACRDAAQWVEDVRVAVNVSPIQFANQAFPSMVMSALAGAQLAPERLELEITESVFLNDGADTDAMFTKLKALGVRLALDDFGTGYSSLGYLKKAPFDKIKIDQSFVRGAAIKGSRNSAIIKAIVSLAEALGMDTTAEGAETRDELDLIRQLGCSHIQGYIYGRPMVAADVLARQRSVGVMAQAEGFKSSRPERKTMLRSIAVLHDGHVYHGKVRNISATGALIEGLWNVPVDTMFSMELTDGLTVNARARWSRDDRMGVEFISPIDLSRLRGHAAAPRAIAS